jgi:hypothetical protein
MKTFETTDQTLARRCRFAQYRNERATFTIEGSLVTGLVRSVREVPSSLPCAGSSQSSRRRTSRRSVPTTQCLGRTSEIDGTKLPIQDVCSSVANAGNRTSRASPIWSRMTQSRPQPPSPVCILAVRRALEAHPAALLVSRDVLTKAQMSACGG